MTIMRMTEQGKLRFMAFLDSQKTSQPQPFPQELLTSSEFTEVIGGSTVMLDELNLEDSLLAARGLDKIVTDLELTSAERDWGFWTWCSAYLFDRLCKKSGGHYKPGEAPIWVAEPDNWQRYYRHYLASIWRVYVAHREKEGELIVLLNGPVNTPGELWGQIAATQTLITNPSMIEAIYHLYWDKQKRTRKRGAGGKSPRRLTRVLRQFERTYDFVAMTGDQIVGLLPSEFDRFKDQNTE
ncbi:hypothetical protein [Aeromonas salmonicida]|uniref:hypothetical protein n=1 Tax=Aeromonas salmonicida TaxID=645 RepID=UPI00259D6D0A|nr:hypothetical protein [Aeromonas salmonicida]MDM5100451.1 hypothetical protein [Aeromonas salmonicida]